MLIPAAKGGIRVKIDKEGRVKGRTVPNRDELEVGGSQETAQPVVQLFDFADCTAVLCVELTSNGFIVWQVDYLEYSGLIDDFGTLSLVEEQAGRIVRC